MLICLFQHVLEVSEDDPLPSEDEEPHVNVGDVKQINDGLLSSASDVDDDFGMESENNCKHFNITVSNVQTVMLLICNEPPNLFKMFVSCYLC